MWKPLFSWFWGLLESIDRSFLQDHAVDFNCRTGPTNGWWKGTPLIQLLHLGGGEFQLRALVGAPTRVAVDRSRVRLCPKARTWWAKACATFFPTPLPLTSLIHGFCQKKGWWLCLIVLYKSPSLGHICSFVSRFLKTSRFQGSLVWRRQGC